MIVLHASVPIDPEQREEALDVIEDLVEESQQESGTIDYRATTDIQDPNVVRVFEQYEDEAALEAHSQSEHFQAFEERLPEFIGGEPEITRFDVEDATEMEL